MFKIGIDSVEIARIKKSMQNPRFLGYILGDEERRLMEEKDIPAQSVAARFAAKEAFSKAIGTGLSGISLNDIQVLNDEKGKPYLVLSGTAKEIADENGLDFDVSLTHTDTTATAAVIAFKREKR